MASTSGQTETARVRIAIPVYDLSCGGGGALTAERALSREPGVLRAYVNPATEMAYVEYDPAACDVPRLREVLRQRGFRSGEPIPR